MDSRQLRTFLEISRLGSFTRAATRLGYAQSTVTAQIKALESEFGIRLLDRGARRVGLTAAGSALVRHAEDILRRTEDARSHVRSLCDGESGGELRVGAPETLCAYRLPTVLRAVSVRHPGIRVSFRSGSRADLLDDLASGALDAAFLLEPRLHAGPLLVEALVPEPLTVIAAPGHPLTALPRIRGEDLDDETVLLLDRGCAQRTVFERHLADLGARHRSAMEFTSVEAVKRCVGAGLGIAAVPAVAVDEELRRGGLVALPWPDHDFGLFSQIARHRDRSPTPALTALTETAKELWTAG
jgi:DNA-binding transcriptional LysR family regulator